MDYFKNSLRKTGFTSLFTSIAFAIIGLLLIMKPDESIRFVSGIVGGIFIAIGVYKIAQFVMDRTKMEMFNFYYDLAIGIISIIFGIIIIAYSAEIIAIFKIIIGLWIVYSSIVRFSMAIQLKQMLSKSWSPVMVLAIIMFLIGLFMIFASGSIVITLGIIILAYSIIDIIESIFFLVNFRNLK